MDALVRRSARGGGGDGDPTCGAGQSFMKRGGGLKVFFFLNMGLGVGMFKDIRITQLIFRASDVPFQHSGARRQVNIDETVEMI